MRLSHLALFVLVLLFSSSCWAWSNEKADDKDHDKDHHECHRAKQCFVVPAPIGQNFLYLQLWTKSHHLRCEFYLGSPYNTSDSLDRWRNSVVIQLTQPELKICCSGDEDPDFVLEASNIPYVKNANGHISFNESLEANITIPFDAFLIVTNEDDFNFELSHEHASTLHVSNKTLSPDCKLGQPFLTILGAVGGADLADIPIPPYYNVSAQDGSFILSIVPQNSSCSAVVKLHISATPFNATPSSCLSPLPNSVFNCSVPCHEEDAFVCFPGESAITNLFSPNAGNITVTITLTSVYPFGCTAAGKQITTEGQNIGSFVAAANTTYEIDCTVIGATALQPPFPTFDLDAVYSV